MQSNDLSNIGDVIREEIMVLDTTPDPPEEEGGEVKEKEACIVNVTF